jgi:signal transduction histidine kinase
MSNTSHSAQFTTRARVVDLLGREQIADAPTAMGEIFKNAMDAGAANVWVDYWPKERCLIVGDDGLGMRTEEELLGKWLVLATDSKQQALDPKSSWLEFATATQKKHLLHSKAFGKKGIGRLAIGLLGGATVVWTRWGKGALAQRTLMLVHWSVFRHPFLTLDDIKIPMMTLKRAATVDDVNVLIKEALEWTKESKAFRKGLPTELANRVTIELTKTFPSSLKATVQFAGGSGTQFVILGSDDMVANHFDGWLGTQDVWGDDELGDSEGPKAYAAFSNPFSNDDDKRLTVHLSKCGKEMDLAVVNFWRNEDLNRADHSLDLKVDETGFVSGKVRRLKEKFDFEWQIQGLPNRSQWPGSYQIRLGYIEGERDMSSLSPEEFANYTRRLNALGGFYVYMDGIRVCPYGRVDEDFVEFEKRRSANAGRNFFSHRHMFGAVILTQSENPDLVEKAGREGFQQNGAYRGLVYSLKKLFTELARTYFGSDAAREDKAKKKDDKAKKKREERQAQLRKEFLKQLSLSRKLLPSLSEKFQIHADEVSAIVGKAERAKKTELLVEARNAQGELRGHYELLWDEGMVTAIPTEFELGDSELDAVDGYLTKLADADRDAKTALAKLAARIDAVASKIEEAASRKRAGRKVLDEARNRFSSELMEAVKPVCVAADHLKKAIQQKPGTDIEELDAIAVNAMDRPTRSEASEASLALVEEIVATQTRILQDKQLPFYKKVCQQLTTLTEGDSDTLEIADLREELRHLRERELHVMELAQFGLVMETADHDFHSMLGDASKAVAAVEAACAPAVRVKVKVLKDYLQHLEDRLQGLDPLVRRVRGRVTDISGEEIREFVQSAFEQHRREGVTFEYTPKFLSALFSGVKRPVLLGAVHNLVMNAGYWATRTTKQGKIRFSIHPQGFVISDSGAGIHQRDRGRVFDPGFSRRPAGRGLGLYIARTCLRSFDYDIELLPETSNNALPGANFLVRKPTAKD